ncbi:response regulator [Paracoccus sp. S-4012]|uniref:response regulator n=1 Tax=Paracoccus sp. S-4012 TaxID=2665648 RepID=UPI0012AF91DB|nr:response regulator [Paracoccus sp. S-4012]MRX51339.1 response regulator [Paracoccus sp. S-4012]
MPPAQIFAGRHILLVEDDFVIALDQAASLAEAGARVVGPAPTLAAALKLVAEAERLDGAILDVNLRGELSYPVADALRARSVPFVFLTGYDRSTISASYPNVPVCEKPFNLTRIAEVMFG